MLFSDPNAFERQTALELNQFTREQVVALFQASEAVSRGKWTKALEKITRYKQLARHRPSSPPLTLEVYLVQAFCHYHLSHFEQTQNILEQLLSELDPAPDQAPSKQFHHQNSYNQSLSSNLSLVAYKSLAVRAHTLAAVFVINSEKTSFDFRQIKQRLLQLLQPQEMRVFLPQVLGTLTGCKHFSPLLQLQNLPGQPSPKLAQKYRIVADWKFIAGLTQQAIDFKAKSVKIWKLLNNHQELIQSQQELKDLQSQNKSEYLIKLKRIKILVSQILKLEQPNPLPSKQTLFKWDLSLLLLKLIPTPLDEKSKAKKTSLSQSVLKKEMEQKSNLQHIIQLSSDFVECYKKQVGSEATNLLLNSRFLQEGLKRVRKTLTILMKIKSKQTKLGFLHLKKNCELKKKQKYFLE